MMLLKHIFDQGRCDLLAGGGNNQLLLPASDPEKTVGIDLTHVTRKQPTISKHFSSLLGRFVVSAKHHFTAQQDLAILGDLHFTTRHRWANSSKLIVVRSIKGHADIFGQAVSLKYRHS